MSMMIHRGKKKRRSMADNKSAVTANEENKELLPPSDSDITFEERTEQKQYTKTEIQRMTTAELQALAAEVGIEDAFETSGNELKKKLTEHFGL